jgi:dTDP-4-dehydrorhamnose reductase
MSAPRVVVIGAGGQLGLELMRAQPRAIGLTRANLDLTDLEAIGDAIKALEPDVVINASGYTAVDRAESEPGAAVLLNRDAPAVLARAAADRGASFVHVSTDYVFDGAKPAPYVENDARAPINVYGRSKAEGEDAVLAAHPRSTILRTSWVYSAHRANFVKTMLRLGETREDVSVVADQYGRPTAAADLAQACLYVGRLHHEGDARASGVFHYAGVGDATWADFAEAIFVGAEARGRKLVRVNRIATADYPTPARRPINSRLDTSKIEGLGAPVREWREALDRCLDELLAA